MTGLAEVLAAVARQHDGSFCICGDLTTDPEMHLGREQETAVLAWLRERLASEEVRAAVRDAVQMAYFEGGASSEDIDRLYADAALTAVVGALEVEGEAGLGSRERGNGHESDERGTGGGRVHRDAERGSNANDVIRGDG